MIRLPEIPGLQPTQINAPQVNPRAAAAPAQQLGTLAESIAGVSEQFHDHAVQLQKIENARILSEKRQQLAQGYADFQIELQKDPDPASRIQKTRDWLTQAKGSMDTENLAPAVRDQLTGHFENFATSAVIRQAEDSSRLAIRRAGLTFQNEMDQAQRTNDRPTAERVIQAARDSGAILPEEADKALRQFDEVSAYNAHQSIIRENPIDAERDLESPDFLKKNPNITPDAYNSLRRQAAQEANNYRADFVNDLIISGKNPTEQDLAEMESRGLLDKSTHARWLTKIREAPVAEIDPAIYEQTYTQIMGYDPKADPSGIGISRLRQWIGSQHLPTKAIQELNDRLTERINPATEKDPANSAGFASKISTDFNRGDFGKYRFPVDHDNNPATEPIFQINREEYDKAWKLRGQFSEQWRQQLASMPKDPTFDQINTAYEALKKSFQDKKPLPDLQFSKPSPPVFDPQKLYQSTTPPSGTFGGQPVKPAGEPYTGAAATIFGGKNDPADNGRSALGGTTGPGGREGTAIPEKLLSAKFPGKDKQWISDNVRTVVRDSQGIAHVLPVADYGTAEWVWKRNGRPTLDLTEGAAKQLGGEPVYQNGKLTGVRGIDALDFSVVSIDTGGADLGSLSWQDAKAAWFQHNRPQSYQAADNSLLALREAWTAARAENPQPLDDLVLRPGQEGKVTPIPNAKPGQQGLTYLSTSGDAIIDANTRIAADAAK